MHILLEHVRSFSKQQKIPLRPLTLLVGENSSGKSTFLAMVSCIFDAARFPVSPGFNEPPYSLGTFDTIATYKGGKYGRDDSFSLGFFDEDDEGESHEVVATYGSEYGDIVLRRFLAKGPLGLLELTISGSKLSGVLSPADSGSQGLLSYPVEFSRKLDAMAPGPPDLLYQVWFAILDSIRTKGLFGSAEEADLHLHDVVFIANPPYRSCFSFAPIRSKPRRTYDEFSEEYSPEGDHIPTLLARLFKQETNSVDAGRVQEALLRFGKESGLFKRIDVKRLGKKVSDPFQVQVSLSGPSVNLTDVGYGVSQALPIVVQSVLKTTSKVLLMQQPEVHLHPRAQAALGTFFAGLAAGKDRLFLIETHSDHLVDRVRQEVARGTISHEKVLILFFHKPQLETTVWPITLDENGNVVDAPPEYRGFFLEEELKLLSRTGG